MDYKCHGISIAVYGLCCAVVCVCIQILLASAGCANQWNTHLNAFGYKYQKR